MGGYGRIHIRLSPRLIRRVYENNGCQHKGNEPLHPSSPNQVLAEIPQMAPPVADDGSTKGVPA